MENLMVITAVGSDRAGIVDELTQAILDYGGNVEDSRMSVLGGEFAVIVLVSGSWNAIAKLEDSLPRLQERLNLILTGKRTQQRTEENNLVPYAVEVVAMDHPGIVNDVAKFFSARQINVEDLYTATYKAAHTGTPMFSLHMTVGIPADMSIAAIRGDFMDFCDNLNLDAMLAPVK